MKDSFEQYAAGLDGLPAGLLDQPTFTAGVESFLNNQPVLTAWLASFRMLEQFGKDAEAPWPVLQS